MKFSSILTRPFIKKTECFKCLQMTEKLTKYFKKKSYEENVTLNNWWKFQILTAYTFRVKINIKNRLRQNRCFT